MKRELISRRRNIFSDKLVQISTWKFATQEELHRNRLYVCECGEPEHNSDALNITFMEPRKTKDVNYYKQDEFIYDYTETLPVFDMDAEKKFKLLKWRFRNNKLYNGISLALNSFDEAELKMLQDDILHVVSEYSETFDKYMDDTSVYDVKYHPKAKETQKDSDTLVYGKLKELITRIKFYIIIG